MTLVFGAAQWSVRCLSLTGGACGSPCAPSQALFLFDSMTAPSHLHGSLRAAFAEPKKQDMKEREEFEDSGFMAQKSRGMSPTAEELGGWRSFASGRSRSCQGVQSHARRDFPERLAKGG